MTARRRKGTSSPSSGSTARAILEIIFFSLSVNFAFLILVVKGCQSEDVPTKRFLFVLNRSGADLITSGVTLFYLIMSLSAPCLEDVHFGCTTKESLLHPLPLQMVVSLDFYLVATSYCGVALLIVYAVRNPIIYKIRVTVRHVYASIMISWVLLLLALSAIYANHGFNESFDSNGMIYIMLHGYHGEISYWQSDVCTNLARQQPILLGIVSLAIPCILLLMATGSYILVARALCTRQQSGLHQNALLRLGMHLGLFAFTVVLMSSTYFVSTPLASFCKNGSRNEDSCGFKPFASYSFLTAITSFGWYLRMTLDPIIDVAVDVTLRRLLLKRPRHRLSTYTLSTEAHRFSMTVRSSSRADSILQATRV